ncbi:MAG: alpha-L-fucosidase [Kiritimatiellia bacterium]
MFAGTEESPQLAAAKKWFGDAQYGMMVHWGLYALIGGEWNGRRMDKRYIGEWAQQYFRIPNAEYSALAEAFNPILFDAEEWVKIARDAGMKYVVFTSKHHDGFAMYHSRVSKFNVVDATPFGRDVVGELAEACRKHGMKLGLYYSQDLDWHEHDGGGYNMGKTWSGGAAWWTNNWDFPDKEKKNFTRYFESKAVPQVKEILTGYGDLCLIWFDIGNTLSREQSNYLYKLVRKLQPGCLINSRIGCGKCDYTSAGDNCIPDDDKSGVLFETPATLNDTWGYKAHDQNWKSAARIREVREHLARRGANYLLNVGPDGLGRIPAPCIDILRESARKS